MLEVDRRRTLDLVRLATGGRGVLPQGQIATDLASRLAREARKTAGHFLNICIRALDYCPPVDITFGEFLRAMVTADRDLEPADPWGYRSLLIESFRARGIYPSFAFSLAEDSVVWQPFEGKPDATGIDFRRIRFRTDPGAQEHALNRRMLHDFVNRKRNKRLFDLEPDRPAHVRSVQPLRRIGPDRRLHTEIVIEVLQTGPRLARYSGAPPFRAGTTLILSEAGQVRYSIFKRYRRTGRMERQRSYLYDLAARIPAHAWQRPLMGLSFARIHGGL